jgi:hypothetical protein
VPEWRRLLAELEVARGDGVWQCAFVYIREAHAEDEWPIGSSVVVPQQPRSLDERAGVARRCVAALGLEDVTVLVDHVDDAYERTFHAWPVRFHVVDADGRVRMVGEPDAHLATYRLRESVLEWFARERPVLL